MYWLQCELRRFAVPTKIRMKLSYCKQNTTSTPLFVWEKKIPFLVLRPAEFIEIFNPLDWNMFLFLWKSSRPNIHPIRSKPRRCDTPLESPNRCTTLSPPRTATVAPFFLPNIHGTSPPSRNIRPDEGIRKPPSSLGYGLVKGLISCEEVLLGGDLRFPWNMELKHQALQQLDWCQ